MYSYTSTVRFSECNAHRELTVPAMLNYLQDCSTFHCEHVRHGFDYTTEHGFAWFIMAWQIVIDRLPRFCQTIQTSTWCHSMHPASANRNFLMTDANGDTLVRADSLWVTVDVTTGKPMRVPDDEKVLLSDEPRLELPPLHRKIKLTGEGRPCDAIQITEQHLDANRHVNNGQYLVMADHLIRARDPDFDLGTLQIQYKEPAKLGDVIVPTLYAEPDGYAVNLASQADSSYCVIRMARNERTV